MSWRGMSVRFPLIKHGSGRNEPQLRRSGFHARTPTRLVVYALHIDDFTGLSSLQQRSTCIVYGFAWQIKSRLAARFRPRNHANRSLFVGRLTKTYRAPHISSRNQWTDSHLRNTRVSIFCNQNMQQCICVKPMRKANVPIVTTPMLQPSRNTNNTRMWADAQRDGRRAEYRWCPLFNDAKIG